MAQHAPNRRRCRAGPPVRCLIMLASGPRDPAVCRQIRLGASGAPRRPVGRSGSARARREDRWAWRRRSADPAPVTTPGGRLGTLGARDGPLHIGAPLSIALSTEPRCAFCRLPSDMDSAGRAARRVIRPHRQPCRDGPHRRNTRSAYRTPCGHLAIPSIPGHLSAWKGDRSPFPPKRRDHAYVDPRAPRRTSRRGRWVTA
jgi:hypothetical protein